MDPHLTTGQSSSLRANVRGVRQNQRPPAGQTPMQYAGYDGASSYPAQHARAQLAPPHQPIPSSTPHKFFNNAFPSSFGFPDTSDIFGSSAQGLAHPVSSSTAENVQDQTFLETGPPHLSAYGDDTRGLSSMPGSSPHFHDSYYPQPQVVGELHPRPSIVIAPQTGSSGNALHAPETIPSSRQDASTSSRGQSKTLNLTEEQLRTLDESAKRIMRDYAGNNQEARDLLFSYLQDLVAIIRASLGQPRLGAKQKEYVLILPIGEPGPKGGYDHWKCGVCQDDKMGKDRTFQKIAGHFISKHFHHSHPKPDLWVCDQPGCTRGYSGLNELNRHRSSEHGFLMPKKQRTPAASPPAHLLEPENVPGPLGRRRSRRVEPYPGPSSSQVPSPTRPRHGNHFTAPGGNTHSAHYGQATTQALPPPLQGYVASMPDPAYQLSFNQSGQTQPSMPTPTHFSPAEANPRLSPSPSMPIPSVPLWGIPNQFPDPYGQFSHPQQGGPQYGQ